MAIIIIIIIIIITIIIIILVFIAAGCLPMNVDTVQPMRADP